MIDAALHSKRSDRGTLKGRKAQIEEEISSLRTFHLHKLELLQEEEEELTRRVQEAVRAVSAQEAEARVEQESLQNEQLDALRELRYQGSDKLMFEVRGRVYRREEVVRSPAAVPEDMSDRSGLCRQAQGKQRRGEEAQQVVLLARELQ